MPLFGSPRFSTRPTAEACRNRALRLPPLRKTCRLDPGSVQHRRCDHRNGARAPSSGPPALSPPRVGSPRRVCRVRGILGEGMSPGSSGGDGPKGKDLASAPFLFRSVPRSTPPHDHDCLHRMRRGSPPGWEWRRGGSGVPVPCTARNDLLRPSIDPRRLPHRAMGNLTQEGLAESTFVLPRRRDENRCSGSLLFAPKPFQTESSPKTGIGMNSTQ